MGTNYSQQINDDNLHVRCQGYFNIFKQLNESLSNTKKYITGFNPIDAIFYSLNDNFLTHLVFILESANIESANIDSATVLIKILILEIKEYKSSMSNPLIEFMNNGDLCEDRIQHLFEQPASFLKLSHSNIRAIIQTKYNSINDYGIDTNFIFLIKIICLNKKICSNKKIYILEYILNNSEYPDFLTLKQQNDIYETLRCEYIWRARSSFVVFINVFVKTMYQLTKKNSTIDDDKLVLTTNGQIIIPILMSKYRHIASFL